MITLPSSPFSLASLHFPLGFLYIVTLIFSHRTYNLSTAFVILKAALYLSIPFLHDEIQARIVQEMMHALFHAFIMFNEYESLTGGKWGTGRCRYHQFRTEQDLKNPVLECEACRSLVGIFGVCVPTSEDLGLDSEGRWEEDDAHECVLTSHCGGACAGEVGDQYRCMSGPRKPIDELLVKDSEKCFGAEEWMEIMENNGVRFEDGERVEWGLM
ncbi:hypothetical protein CVT25_004949 [Psilocybe cyanescens]|uniref:Uncharacterized protein n=1 Tax=Psilocybe cyanescens TaxID=93625 RepID=A0A409XU03_PSICY|nr:hypothetical protein CVT25_004949 [Psilocybe cyanescens]